MQIPPASSRASRACIIALLGLVTPTPAQDPVAAPTGVGEFAALRIGDPAPPVTVEVVYDRPETFPDPTAFRWQDLAGRVVVLDFAASWCGPCVASLPHLAELAAELRDEPVTFLLISNESEREIAELRKQHAIAGLVARDEDGSTFEAYRVNGIPHCVVVDAQGRIAAATHPQHVTADALRKVLAGEAIDLPLTNPAPQPRDWDARPLPTRDGEEAWIAPAAAYGGRESMGRDGRIEIRGLPVRTIVATAWSVEPRDVVYEVEFADEEYFDVLVRPVDGKRQSALLRLRELLERKFGIEVVHESRQREVKLLRRLPDAPALPESTTTKGRSRAMGGSFELQHVTMADFAKTLRMVSARPVIDDTGLTGHYDISLRWDLQNARESFVAAFTALGFELVDGTRELDVPIVRPRVKR